jgi:Tol biopolymer transport system component
VLDLKKGTYTTVARSGDNGRYAESGHLLCARAGTLFALPFDLAHLKATGPEAPVIEGVSAVGVTSGFADYSFSRAGLLVYADALSAGGTQLTWRDRKGAETPLAGQVPRQWGTGSLSHDGRRVANGITAERGADIWVVDLARGTPTRLTFAGSNDNPIWTRDDRALIYGESNGAKPGLYEISADGSGQPRLILAGSQLIPWSITADGKTLLYSGADSSGKPAIMVLPLDTPGATPHAFRESAGADQFADVSPDGKWMALTSNESGRNEVYVLPFSGPGPKTQISAEGGVRPRWVNNGRELLFWDTIGGNATLLSVNIQAAPFSASTPQKLFTSFSGTTWGATADGQHFLVESVQNGASIVTVTNWFDELRRRAPAKK